MLRLFFILFAFPSTGAKACIESPQYILSGANSQALQAINQRFFRPAFASQPS